jgi:hypothetical protein
METLIRNTKGELMPLSHGVLAELQDLRVLSENAVAG